MNWEYEERVQLSTWLNSGIIWTLSGFTPHTQTKMALRSKPSEINSIDNLRYDTVTEERAEAHRTLSKSVRTTCELNSTGRSSLIAHSVSRLATLTWPSSRLNEADAPCSTSGSRGFGRKDGRAATPAPASAVPSTAAASSAPSVSSGINELLSEWPLVLTASDWGGSESELVVRLVSPLWRCAQRKLLVRDETVSKSWLAPTSVGRVVAIVAAVVTPAGVTDAGVSEANVIEMVDIEEVGDIVETGERGIDRSAGPRSISRLVRSECCSALFPWNLSFNSVAPSVGVWQKRNKFVTCINQQLSVPLTIRYECCFLRSVCDRLGWK